MATSRERAEQIAADVASLTFNAEPGTNVYETAVSIIERAFAPTDAEREAMEEVAEAARKAPDRLRRSIVFVTRSRRFAQELEQVAQEILRALARLDSVRGGRGEQ